MATENAISQFLKSLDNNEFESAKGLTTLVLKELKYLPSMLNTDSTVKTIRDLVKDVKQGKHDSWKGKFRRILGGFNMKLKGPLEEARKEIKDVEQLSHVPFKEQDKPSSQLQGSSQKTMKPSTKAENTKEPSSRNSITAKHLASGKKNMTGVSTTQQQGIAKGKPTGNSAPNVGQQTKPASEPKVESRKGASLKVSQRSVKPMYTTNSSSKISQKRPSENQRPFAETKTSFSSSQQQPSEIRESGLKESKYVSHALSYNNPNIADLSDPNRPTKLAEKYSELYDNEWTEAFEAMTKLKKKPVSETDIIGLLLLIVEEAYKFCLEEANNLRTDIMKKVEEKKPEKSELSLEELAQMVESKKQKAEASVSNLQKKFCDNNLQGICDSKNLNAPSKDGATARYAKRAVELTWWMCIQDPPVHMVTSNTTFDPRLYKAYTKSGSKPEYFVWPPLKLYKEGDVLTKGVVQYM